MPGPHVINGKDAQYCNYKESGSPLSRLSPDADIPKETSSYDGDDEHDAQHYLSYKFSQVTKIPSQSYERQDNHQNRAPCEYEPSAQILTYLA